MASKSVEAQIAAWAAEQEARGAVIENAPPTMPAQPAGEVAVRAATGMTGAAETYAAPADVDPNQYFRL